MNSTKGGHCNGTESGGFLKIEMHVCQDGGKMIKNFFVVKFNIQFFGSNTFEDERQEFEFRLKPR